MPEYLVLLAPSSNRVYAGDAPAITAAEAEIVVSAVHLGGVVGASPTTVAGVPYLAVELADAVDPRILGRPRPRPSPCSSARATSCNR